MHHSGEGQKINSGAFFPNFSYRAVIAFLVASTLITSVDSPMARHDSRNGTTDASCFLVSCVIISVNNLAGYRIRIVILLTLLYLLVVGWRGWR